MAGIDFARRAAEGPAPSPAAAGQGLGPSSTTRSWPRKSHYVSPTCSRAGSERSLLPGCDADPAARGPALPRHQMPWLTRLLRRLLAHLPVRDGPATRRPNPLRPRAQPLSTTPILLRPRDELHKLAEKAWRVPEEHQASRYYFIGYGLGMAGEWPNIPHHHPGQPYPLAGVIKPRRPDPLPGELRGLGEVGGRRQARGSVPHPQRSGRADVALCLRRAPGWVLTRAG